MKIENTGVNIQQECDQVNAYHNRLGCYFEIEPAHTVNNPGLRQVAKICLTACGGNLVKDVVWMSMSLYLTTAL